jgi:hypothetical protein
MARPGRGDDSRTEVITIRVTRAEKVRLDHRAATAGLSLSSWAARALADGRVTVETRPAVRMLPPELVAEFKRIGNNLNQIAHALNARKSVADGRVAREFADFLTAMMRNEYLRAKATPLVNAILNSAGRVPK